MKNIINYYYNLNIMEIYDINNGFYFNYNDNSYIFVKYNRQLNELDSIYNIYIDMKNKKLLVNDIVINRNNQIISMIDGIPYILIQDNTKNTKISLNDILYLQNNTMNVSNDKKIYRTDWIKMWELKIDYYDSKTNELSNKYSLLNETLDYYIGLGENAICYLIYNPVKINNIVLSHKRTSVYYSTFDFYNPINFVLDSRVRDFSEYIKDMFFHQAITFDEFKKYIDYMNFTRDEYILLISRLLFPTYYFDLFDLIINENIKEEKIKNVLNKNNDYIIFLKNTFYYIIYTKKINIPFIEWIIKY